jgi:hypothetical protein
VLGEEVTKEVSRDHVKWKGVVTKFLTAVWWEKR